MFWNRIGTDCDNKCIYINKRSVNIFCANFQNFNCKQNITIKLIDNSCEQKIINP